MFVLYATISIGATLAGVAAWAWLGLSWLRSRRPPPPALPQDESHIRRMVESALSEV